MHDTTAEPARGGTGSATIADIVSLAAERYGERPAARFKRDGEWRDASYVALAEALDARLVTADARLSRAPGVSCPVGVLSSR